MVYSASTPLKLVATSAENGYCMLLEHGRGSRDEREAPATTIAYTPTGRRVPLARAGLRRHGGLLLPSPFQGRIFARVIDNLVDPTWLRL
jgi:hypothetical protein